MADEIKPTVLDLDSEPAKRALEKAGYVTRGAVTAEADEHKRKLDLANREVRARGLELIKEHGGKWNGKAGEGEGVYVVADALHRALAEVTSLGLEHDATARNLKFSDLANKAISGSRQPLVQEDAAELAEELASRCSLKRLYNMAANDQLQGRSEKCWMPKNGAEFEADKEIRLRAQNFPGGSSLEMGGVCLPVNMPTRARNMSRSEISRFNRRMKRDALAGDFPTAGALIPPEFKFPTIELLRNKMAMARAGITILSGVIGNLVLPRQTAATTPQSLPEGAILAAYDQTFDQIRLVPHRVGSKQLYSRLALLQTTEDFEALVLNDHMAQNALYVDEMILNGTGGNDQPLGLLNAIGIGVVTFGGSAPAAYKNLVALETSIRSANIDEEPTYITTSVGRGTFRVTPTQLTDSTVVSGQTNALWVGEDLVGRPAVDSQQVPNNIVVALVGRHVVLAQWGGWQTVIDTLTFADSDKIRISMNTYIDTAMRHPQAIARSADSIAVLN
jgi:HK97 family phage major capsid protein